MPINPKSKRLALGRRDALQLESLEAHLSSALQPVAPRSAFVENLGQRLSSSPPVEVATRPAAWRDWQVMLMAVVGVLSGVVLAVLGIRALRVLALSLALRRSKGLA